MHWALIAAAVPFEYPHLLEKSGMLLEGRLTKPIDIFDLFFHSLPLVLLIAKIARNATQVVAALLCR
ncbi:MAG: hypothetical protein R3338_01620 [Thermoanaerobaculia bacterium]|nr:hypothetical protein [Thermoanaerobaculia bacterium]